MKKALITGASGFVGKFLKEELVQNNYEVWGGTRGSSPSLISEENTVQLDFSNRDSIRYALELVEPDIIFHLSGQSSVKYSWDHIIETFSSNLMDSIVLLDAVKSSPRNKMIKIVSVGSSEEYGTGVDLPINEKTFTNPINPYGVSKLTVANMMIMYHKSFELNILHARPFNHIGPGQKLGFVTSDFAKQIVDIENKLVDPTIFVGDLSSKRDFTDVRDIVKGYRLLGEKGISGEVYNICSGNCVSIQKILDILLSFSSESIKISVDEDKIRPVNVLEYYGDNRKIRDLCGWEPQIPLEQSLYDIYSYWKNM